MFSVESIGHFHPLLVHLPIGILLFTFGLMLLQRVRQVEVEPAISFGLLVGCVSALLACLTGWLLSQTGDYDNALVSKHQWAGLVTAALSAVTYLFKRFRGLLALATLLALSVAGHWGGTLTHGEGYLWESSATPEKVELPAILPDSQTHALPTSTVRRVGFYQGKVAPILNAKCYSCHSARKKKGGLRLDSEVFIRKGGKHGAVLVAGNPAKSHLFSYVQLPLDDDLHMPPRGKSQLTASEISTLFTWIKKGAPFQEVIEEVAVAPLPTIPTEMPVSTPATESTTALPLANVTAAEAPVEAAAPLVLEKLRAQHLIVSPTQSNHLAVNFVNVKKYSPALLDQLQEIAPQMTTLKLSGQPVTSEDLKRISSCNNLTQVQLENTAITDEGIETLAKLPKLQQLNLYGTAITDQALTTLAQFPNLKTVYLWRTSTTEAGIRQLQKARPSLKIVTGNFAFSKQDTNQTQKP
ncbi:MAG: c-type cytochrome domain-containing protein [Spirosomataceae bacterium]